jgi:hypothetical protein
MHCLDEEVVITAATKIPSEAAQVRSPQRAPQQRLTSILNQLWREPGLLRLTLDDIGHRRPQPLITAIYQLPHRRALHQLCDYFGSSAFHSGVSLRWRGGSTIHVAHQQPQLRRAQRSSGGRPPPTRMRPVPVLIIWQLGKLGATTLTIPSSCRNRQCLVRQLLTTIRHPHLLYGNSSRGGIKYMHQYHEQSEIYMFDQFKHDAIYL